MQYIDTVGHHLIIVDTLGATKIVLIKGVPSFHRLYCTLASLSKLRKICPYFTNEGVSIHSPGCKLLPLLGQLDNFSTTICDSCSMSMHVHVHVHVHVAVAVTLSLSRKAERVRERERDGLSLVSSCPVVWVYMSACSLYMYVA